MMTRFYNMFRMYNCLCQRRTQTRKDSKQIKILYVNMIMESKEKNQDLHHNRFKGIRKRKPVIVQQQHK